MDARYNKGRPGSTPDAQGGSRRDRTSVRSHAERRERAQIFGVRYSSAAHPPYESEILAVGPPTRPPHPPEPTPPTLAALHTRELRAELARVRLTQCARFST